jgi:hypothetical protein
MLNPYRDRMLDDYERLLRILEARLRREQGGKEVGCGGRRATEWLKQGYGFAGAGNLYCAR